EKAGPPRAQRHADPDFIRQPAHRVGHESINPDAGQEHRQQTEEGGKLSDQSLTGYGSLDLLDESIPIRDGETSVDLADGAANFRDDGLRITRIAHLEIVVVPDALSVRIIRRRERPL